MLPHHGAGPCLTGPVPSAAPGGCGANLNCKAEGRAARVRSWRAKCKRSAQRHRQAWRSIDACRWREDGRD